MELTIYQKIWKPSEHCKAITIPTKEAKLLNATKGDILRAKISIIKKQTNQETKTKIPLKQ